MNEKNKKEMWEAITITEPIREGEKPHWNRLGVGFQNKDGSFNIYLHALPVNGKIHLKKKVVDNEIKKAIS